MWPMAESVVAEMVCGGNIVVARLVSELPDNYVGNLLLQPFGAREIAIHQQKS